MLKKISDIEKNTRGQERKNKRDKEQAKRKPTTSAEFVLAIIIVLAIIVWLIAKGTSYMPVWAVVVCILLSVFFGIAMISGIADNKKKAERRRQAKERRLAQTSAESQSGSAATPADTPPVETRDETVAQEKKDGEATQTHYDKTKY